jgi:hypothetical protein
MKFVGLNLDFSSALKELEDLSGSTQYEQLDCLGLEYSLDLLVASFHIKLTSGYSGTLCTAGSNEYVTFWSDWDNTCQWTLLGTVSVDVHDIPDIPADGLAYNAVFPVDLQSIIRTCEQPKVARVRAVLSWGAPSSSTDPNALPVWGNILDAHVQLPPGVPLTSPSIQVIGGIPTPNIDSNGMTTENANFAFGYTLADPLSGRPCPFGGSIIFQGLSPPGATKYRIWAQPAVTDPPPPIFLTQAITTFNFNTLTYETHVPDPGTGWLQYLPRLENINNILGIFPSTDNQLWKFQLEADTGPPTQWYYVQMDNLAPSVDVILTTPGSCGDLPTGGTLQGTFTATDVNFSKWVLGILPGPSNAILPASSGTEEVPPNPGTFTMSTKGMPACGYVIIIEAWDLAILNSAAGPGNNASKAQGFCLTAASNASNDRRNGWEVVEEVE